MFVIFDKETSKVIALFENDSIDIAEDRIEEASKGLNYESGWLTKAIVDKIKNYDKRKKEKEKELLKLDIEIEQLKKKLNGIKK